MQLKSASVATPVAVDLGLEMLADRTGPGPRGRSGHVLWGAAPGLLKWVADNGDPDAHVVTYEVAAGPHAGRRFYAFAGNGWLQPSLKWAETR